MNAGTGASGRALNQAVAEIIQFKPSTTPNPLFMKQPPKVLTILLIICALLSAVPAGAAPAKKKIGFSVYDMQYGFFQDMEKGTKESMTLEVAERTTT